MCFIILIKIIRHLADTMYSFYLFMVNYVILKLLMIMMRWVGIYVNTNVVDYDEYPEGFPLFSHILNL